MPGKQQTPCFIGPQAKWTSRRSEVTGCVTKRHCSETPLCCLLPLVTLGSFSYGIKKGTVLKFFLSISSVSPPTWSVMVIVAHVLHPHSQHGPRLLRRSAVVLWHLTGSSFCCPLYPRATRFQDHSLCTCLPSVTLSTSLHQRQALTSLEWGS